MKKKFKFTNSSIKALPANPKDAKSSTSHMPTVSEFFWNTYLPVAKQRKKSWDDDVSRFEHHCKSIWNIRYDDLKASQVQNVQNEMMTTKSKRGNYAPATCNRVLALLKTIGTLAEKLLDAPNVAKKVSMLPENNARTRYCSIEEVQAIIKEARRYHQFTIGAYIAMLFLTGCRASEKLEEFKRKSV